MTNEGTDRPETPRSEDEPQVDPVADAPETESPEAESAETESAETTEKVEAVSDSNEAIETKDNDEAAKPDAKGKDKKGAKPKRSWRRRLLRFGVGLLIVLVILRFALVAALPSIVNSVLSEHGLVYSCERLSLSVLAGDIELWRAEIREEGKETPALSLEYVDADLSVLDLLTGSLVVHRAEVDGLDLAVSRNAEGKLFFAGVDLESLSQGGAEEVVPEVEEEQEEEEETEALTFDSPLQLDALRVQHVRVHWIDESVAPKVDTHLDASIRVSDLGSPTRQGQFEILLSVDRILDACRIRGDFQGGGAKLNGDSTVMVRGLQPRRIAGYLASIGARADADILSFDAKGFFRGEIPESDPRSRVVNLGLSDISFTDDDERALGLSRVAFAVVQRKRGREQELTISEATVGGIDLSILRTKDGGIRFGGIAVGGEGAPSVAASSGASSAAGSTEAATAKPEELLRWLVQKFELGEARLSFRDVSHDPPSELSFELEKVAASAIRNFEGGEERSQFELRASAPGVAESMVLSGELPVFALDKEGKVQFRLTLDGIRPDALGYYLGLAGVESVLSSAKIECSGELTMTIRSDGSIALSAQLKELVYQDPKEGELFRLGEVRVSETVISAAGDVTVGEVIVGGSRLAVRRENDGAIRALGFRVLPSTKSGSNAAAEPAPAPTPAPAP
ncbi:MAG: hypothetical protein AAF517_12570, partial [Planctomycetota bacterium]